jgi:hypothetical protein
LPNNPPTEAAARARGENDGILWFTRTSIGAGARVKNLVGNVAEFVINDGPAMERTQATSAALSGMLERAGLAVIGGSALSDPQLAVDQAQTVSLFDSAEGLSDVGVRLAFNASGTAPPKEPLPLPSTQVTPPAMKAFSPFTETARTKGTISNLGEAAVDAEATEMGKFMRTVTSAVEKKWHLLRRTHADAVSYGYLKVRFFVNREGRPEDVKFIEKANNPQMEDFTLEAILKAEIPPIPRDLLPMLDGERFPVEYEIIIHD